jgi:hypothetical protein
VILSEKVQEFYECVDLNSLRVHAPDSVLFVCGGRLDTKATYPPSLREAFLRVKDRKPLNSHRVIIAEEANLFFPRGNYKNFLRIEADLAQISELVLLFSESFGSAAELGAFVTVDEIAQHLLVVMDDANYDDDSFIKLGPVRELEDSYPKSVCVLNCADLGIPALHKPASINLNVFFDRISAAVVERSAMAKEHTTFDSSRPGHLIKLVVGLVQHYGALTAEDIDFYFFSILGKSIPFGRIEEFLTCAEFVGWILRRKLGFVTYFTAPPSLKQAVSYKFLPSAEVADRLRWISDIRTTIKSLDPERFRAISGP